MPRAVQHRRPNIWWPTAILATILAAGCDLPRDPEGTLDRARGGTIRVGIDLNDPWTDWEGDDAQGRAVGIEAELIERFAEELDADVIWVRGSEAEWMTAVENFDLDLVAAGLKDDTLWSDRVGLSRPYAKTAEGKHVLAAPPGENEFLLRLDRFLARQEAAVEARLAKEGPVVESGTVE